MKSIESLVISSRLLFVAIIAFTLLIYLWADQLRLLKLENEELTSQIVRLCEHEEISQTDTVMIVDTIVQVDTVYKDREIYYWDWPNEYYYNRAKLRANSEVSLNLAMQDCLLLQRDSLLALNEALKKCKNDLNEASKTIVVGPKPENDCMKSELFKIAEDKKKFARRFLWNKAVKQCNKKEKDPWEIP